VDEQIIKLCPNFSVESISSLKLFLRLGLDQPKMENVTLQIADVRCATIQIRIPPVDELEAGVI